MNICSKDSSTASSPVATQPKLLAMKAPTLRPASAEPIVVTQKEWIIPPRPKPGRKPATDTPPTKRKAQNRAAQRAFRERRAARVSELEDKLKEVETDTVSKESQMAKTIESLSRENNYLRMELEDTRRQLQGTPFTSKASLPPSTSLRQVASPTPSWSGENNAEIDTPESMSSGDVTVVGPTELLRRSGQNRPQKISDLIEEVPAQQSLAGGCGRCFQAGGCMAAGSKHDSSRPASPASQKRSKAAHENLEIDFTSAFSSRSKTTVSTPLPTSSSMEVDSQTNVVDPCGFCTDSSTCVCALAALADHAEDAAPVPIPAHPTALAPSISNTLPPLLDAGACTMAKLPALHPSHLPPTVRVPATTEPGSCSQCQLDPMSFLFCRTLASTRGGSCGKTGGCCKDKASVETPTTNSTYIPCSDVYVALSRHSKWAQVEDLGSLVGKLRTSSVGEVEVSSVRDVLRDMDRKGLK